MQSEKCFSKQDICEVTLFHTYSVNVTLHHSPPLYNPSLVPRPHPAFRTEFFIRAQGEPGNKAITIQLHNFEFTRLLPRITNVWLATVPFPFLSCHKDCNPCLHILTLLFVVYCSGWQSSKDEGTACWFFKEYRPHLCWLYARKVQCIYIQVFTCQRLIVLVTFYRPSSKKDDRMTLFYKDGKMVLPGECLEQDVLPGTHSIASLFCSFF